MLNVTCDMWHMRGRGRWTFFQNGISLALTVWEWKCFEDFEELVTQLLKEYITQEDMATI